MSATSADDFKRWLSSALAEERQHILAVFEARHNLILEGAEQKLLGDQGSREGDAGLDEVSPSAVVSKLREVEEEEMHDEIAADELPRKIASEHHINEQADCEQTPGHQEPTNGKQVALPLPANRDAPNYNISAGFGKFFRKDWLPLPDTAEFEIFFGVIIVLNTVMVCLEMQYNGADIGYKLGYRDFTSPASEGYPGFSDFLAPANIICNVIFTVELIARLILNKRACRSKWVWLDAFIVPVAWLESTELVGVNTSIIRVFRLARTVRVVKIMHSMGAFRVLYFMIRAISTSCHALFWSCVLIGSIQVCTGLFVCQMLNPWFKDEAISEQDRRMIFKYFGTFSQTMFTMYEVSDGNWVGPARKLIDYVDPWWGMFFLLYRCVLFYAFGKVIAAVFITETNRLLANDVKFQQQQMKLKSSELKLLMRQMFEDMDKDQDHMITKKELEAVVDEPEIKALAKLLDLDGGHLQDLFDILDTGDGHIELDNFVKGLPKLKGTASSMEMSAVIHVSRSIAADVRKMQSQLKSQLLLQSSQSSKREATTL